MVGWHSTSLEHAREAQERYGWSDEELVERMLIVRRRLTDAREATTPDGSTTEQIAWLASRLPPLSGVRGDTDLLSLLAEARRPPPTRAPRTGRTPSPPRTRSRSWSWSWRRLGRALLILGSIWAVMFVLAVLVVWLR